MAHAIPPLVLLLATPLLAQQSAPSDVKVPGPLPHQDTELKSEAWFPPAKADAAPTSHAAQSLEMRERIDAAHELMRLSERTRRTEGQVEKGLPGNPAPPENLVEALSSNSRRHFQLDVDSEGALWAFGGTYKARFDGDGAEYTPFMGSTAPRNYPVSISLASITIGGEALAFDGATQPTFAGETAVFDRGSVVERYDLAAGSIEQLFVFDTLPGAGEIVVRMDVESDLAGGETEAGLEFTNALGAVRYGRATVLDADGRAAPAETRLVEGGIEIRVPESFVATAALPLTIDPVISTFTINDDGSDDDLHPDVAFDTDTLRFIVCWERVYSATDHDVWAELWTSGGALVAGSGAYVDFTTGTWTNPAVANNRIASQFLVVAEEGAYPDTEIWGRTREADSTTMGVQFQISSGSGDKRFPDVGGDPHTSGPTYYCVVWERVFDIAVDHDVHARLVRSNSTLLGSSAVLIDNSGGSYDKYPRISNSDGVPSAATQEWNIVWQRQFNATDWDIRGAQVHWSGGITTSSFSVDFSGANDWFPVASSPLDYQGDGARVWMAAYRRDSGSDYDIEATAWKGGSYINDATLSDLGPLSGQDQYEPEIDTNGKHFTVSWSELYSSSTTDRDVYVGSFYLAGNDIHASEAHVNVAFSGDAEDDVRGCARHSGGLTSDWVMYAWVDDAPGNGDIEGALFDMRDHYGNDIAQNYCGPAVPNSTGQSAVAHASGSAIAGGEPLTLSAFRMPPNQFGMWSGTPNGTGSFSPPNNQGVFCLAQPYGRFNRPGEILNSGGNGRVSLDIDTTNLPLFPAVSAMAGQTWRFQFWFRDQNPVQTSNFTDGIAITFY